MAMIDSFIFLPCPMIEVFEKKYNQKPLGFKHRAFIMDTLMTTRVPTMNMPMD